VEGGVAESGIRTSKTRGKKPAGASRYSAPALEKGLDIVEFLAEHPDGCTLVEVASGIARTKGEIFRMLAVLEARHYIERDSGDERYRVTDKLFRLGLRQPKYRALIETAAPFMDAFAQATRYPCHLAIPSGSQIVVVARAEGSDLVGITVKVGYRQSLLDTGSGLCLLAFMSGDDKDRAVNLLRAERRKISESELKRIAKSGGVVEPSRIMEGVWDISCPIFHNGEAVAALTVPYVTLKINATNREAIAKRLAVTATRISAALREGA
jgi:DNA-binding IclR family transcriptional regulator